MWRSSKTLLAMAESEEYETPMDASQEGRNPLRLCKESLDQWQRCRRFCASAEPRFCFAAPSGAPLVFSISEVSERTPCSRDSGTRSSPRQYICKCRWNESKNWIAVFGWRYGSHNSEYN